MSRTKTEDRFSTKVHTDENGCHRWTAAVQNAGYGLFSVGGRMVLAHRWAYEQANGPIPDGMFIDHICHQPACVNPDHLRLATHKQNKENLGGLYKNNTSGYRGVYWDPRGKKWRACIRHNGKRINLGSYTTEDEAGEAARLARNSLFTHNNLDRIA